MKATYAHKLQALRKYVRSGKLHKQLKAEPSLAPAPLLGQREQELLNYLHQQFPATIGHMPLANKIHAIWKQGMDDAADIVRDRRLLLEKNNCKDPIREHYAEYAIRYAAWPNRRNSATRHTRRNDCKPGRPAGFAEVTG